ncbi:hypothetical protein GN156_13160 [bacterium LRH843]|nr:hypothetical protein [bacterium LRH843]
MVLPTPLVQTFYPLYRDYTLSLITKPYLLWKSFYFAEQIAISLAYHDTKIPYKPLPTELNSPIFKPKAERNGYDPSIIHYMKNGLTKQGYIKQGPKKNNVAKRIKAFNRMWRRVRKLYQLGR